MERGNFLRKLGGLGGLALLIGVLQRGGSSIFDAFNTNKEKGGEGHHEAENGHEDQNIGKIDDATAKKVHDMANKGKELGLSAEEIAQTIFDAAMTGIFFGKVIPSFLAGDTAAAIGWTKYAVPGYVGASLAAGKKGSIVHKNTEGELEHCYMAEIVDARGGVAMMSTIVNVVEFININFDSMLKEYIIKLPNYKTQQQIDKMPEQDQLEYTISMLNTKIQYLSVFMTLFGPLTALGQATILKSVVKDLVTEVKDMAIKYAKITEGDAMKLMKQYEGKIMALSNANQRTGGNLGPVVFALSKGGLNAVRQLSQGMLAALPAKLIGMQNELNIIYNSIRSTAGYKEKPLIKLLAEDITHLPQTIISSVGQGRDIITTIPQNFNLSSMNNEVVGNMSFARQMSNMTKEKRIHELDTITKDIDRDTVLVRAKDGVVIDTKRFMISRPQQTQNKEDSLSYPEICYILMNIWNATDTVSEREKNEIIKIINAEKNGFSRLRDFLKHQQTNDQKQEELGQNMVLFLEKVISEPDYTIFKQEEVNSLADKIGNEELEYIAEQFITQHHQQEQTEGKSYSVKLLNGTKANFDYLHLFDPAVHLLGSPTYLAKTLFDVYKLIQYIGNKDADVAEDLSKQTYMSLFMTENESNHISLEKQQQVYHLIKHREPYKHEEDFHEFIIQKIFKKDEKTLQRDDQEIKRESNSSKIHDSGIKATLQNRDSKYQNAIEGCIHYLEHHLGKNSGEIVTMVGVVQAPYIYPLVETLSKAILKSASIVSKGAIKEILKFVGYAVSVTADNYVAEIVMYNLCKKLLPEVTDEEFMKEFAPIPAISGGMAFTGNPAHAIVATYKKLYGAANDYTTDLFDEISNEESKDKLGLLPIAERVIDSVTLSKTIENPGSIESLLGAIANIMRPQAIHGIKKVTQKSNMSRRDFFNTFVPSRKEGKDNE